jgi:hypothetical protein
MKDQTIRGLKYELANVINGQYYLVKVHHLPYIVWIDY